MVKQKQPSAYSRIPGVPMASDFANEVASIIAKNLPDMIRRPRKRTRAISKKLAGGIFLDTSAIIDTRIFEVVRLGLLTDNYVIPEEILAELKHIADSQDMVKRERGKKGLQMLEELKKSKGVKVTVLPSISQILGKQEKKQEVDDVLIKLTKYYKGKIITCDYNLEKKATIQGVQAINMNALAQVLKVTAVPGEALHISIQHLGKDPTQGVGYLDDGTMIVVESASENLGKTVDVVIARVIQTSAGRILFAKKI